MEKYTTFATLTEQFLHGHLEQLDVQYQDTESVTIKILYKDGNDYLFDYELLIDIPKHIVERASHVTEGYMTQVKLHRQKAFERAICSELFQTGILT